MKRTTVSIVFRAVTAVAYLLCGVRSYKFGAWGPATGCAFIAAVFYGLAGVFLYIELASNDDKWAERADFLWRNALPFSGAFIIYWISITA